MKLLLLIIFSLTLAFGYSQDLIIRTNSDTIQCRIVKVKSNTISYYYLNSDTTLLPYQVSRKVVRKIIFANGEEEKYVQGMSKAHHAEIETDEYYADMHKNALKFHALSLFWGSFALTYERSIKPQISIELGAGYIFGINDSLGNFADKGYIIRGGVKLMRPPKYYEKRGAYAHLLKGTYIKPEIIFNSFKRLNVGLSTPKLEVWDYVSSTSLVLNVGKQVVYNNLFLIDWYGFIGYGRADFQNVYFYSNAVLGDALPISLGFGFRLGFLFL